MFYVLILVRLINKLKMKALLLVVRSWQELLRRLQSIQPSRDISRDALLADYSRNRGYLDRGCYYCVPSRHRRANSESRPPRSGWYRRLLLHSRINHCDGCTHGRPVPDMTYNVFGGMLNLTQSINPWEAPSRQGASTNCQFFYHAVLMSMRWANVWCRPRRRRFGPLTMVVCLFLAL